MPVIVFASDHAGFALKEQLRAYVTELGDYIAVDAGAYSEESVDYPDFGHKAADTVLSGKAGLGVIVCGSGIGISIAANRDRKSVV